MALADPLIILTLTRSYSTLVCAMLGRHPQMYGLPETCLFACDTLREWWETFGADGLLRAVAQIVFGNQNEVTIERARHWLWQRLRWNTGDVLWELAQRVHPLILVEKTPITVARVEHMQRALAACPSARFLHLVRHPLGFSQSVLKFLERTNRPFRDPQVRWHKAHSNIRAFLATIPSEQQMRVRGEDLLADPDHHLREIAEWIGLRSDPEAIEEMKHPERSPFASFGPRNAPMGGDPNFFQQPTLRASKVNVQSLEGPLPWRKDGFSKEVRELACQFGYV
jgi:hypothetical protein